MQCHGLGTQLALRRGITGRCTDTSCTCARLCGSRPAPRLRSRSARSPRCQSGRWLMGSAPPPPPSPHERHRCPSPAPRSAATAALHMQGLTVHARNPAFLLSGSICARTTPVSSSLLQPSAHCRLHGRGPVHPETCGLQHGQQRFAARFAVASQLTRDAGMILCQIAP